MLGQRIRDSSKISETSFVGTVPLGCILLFSEQVFEPLTEMTGTCAQEDRLWIADPRAINHILQKSGYLYAKTTDARELAGLVADPSGILSAEGELPVTINPLSLLAGLTGSQVIHISVTGGRWLQRSVSLRLRLSYRISWMSLLRHANPVGIRS